MQEHPIPQNITTYRFRLVGPMTLKQFLELASGIVTAWIIYSSNLNFIFKWTLGPLAAFFGIGLAFVPYQDRPLDQWIINFFKAIYGPTQYLWKPSPKIIDIFAPTKTPVVKDKPLPPQPKHLQEYLKTLPQSPPNSFEKDEDKYLEYIQSLFGALGSQISITPTESTQPKNPVKSSVSGVRIRKLMDPQLCFLSPNKISPSLALKKAAMPAVSVKLASKPKPVTKTVQTPSPSIKPTASAPVLKKSLSPQPIKPKPVVIKPAPTSPAVFTSNVILPQISNQPNLVSGITLNQQNQIIANVILEIRDAKDQPVRALKSNKLGQFFIATPLSDGIYKIEADHPDHRFAIIKLEAKGETIPPLKIQATK